MNGRTRLSFAVLLLLIAPAAQAATSASLQLLTPASYVPGIPLSVRVELRNAEGQIDRETWDAEAVLSADDPGINLSTNRVRLINGLGSVLVAIQGTNDFQLTAESEGHAASRHLENWQGVPWREVSGLLEGASTTWSGIVHVTNDVTVPAGHELIIASNTWVLVDGVAAGPPAADLLVFGSLRSLGTELHPVTITSADPDLHWGQIRHETASPSLYRHTIVTRAGQSPREPHTNRGPAIRGTNSVVHFEYCTISDHADATGGPGKILQADRCEIIINDCLMARSRMGPEFNVTIVHCTNTWFVEMNAGIDDEDGIYIHYQGPGRKASLVGCVVADITDDGVDTIGSELIVRDCIIRDVADKGMSITGGESDGHVLVEDCLFDNCYKGISTKGATVHTIFVNRTTINSRNTGIYAEKRAITTTNLVRYYITNSIVEATAPGGVAIHTDYGVENIHVYYSNILNTNWPGPGNLNLDPMFVDRANHDYHLLADSPCIDAGDPDSRLDPDGTRADMGVFPYWQPPDDALRLLSPGVNGDGRFSMVLSGEVGRGYFIQGSTNLLEWITLDTVTNTEPLMPWVAPETLEPQYFYRLEQVP